MQFEKIKQDAGGKTRERIQSNGVYRMGEVDNDKRAMDMLIVGASISQIRAAIGDGADKAIEMAKTKVQIQSAEDITRWSIERLSYLTAKLMAAASTGDDKAIRSVLQITTTQQKLALDFETYRTDAEEETTLDRFRREHEERRKKNKPNIKK